jgi:hypothetical protein
VASTEFITARYPDAEMPRTQTKGEALTRVRDFLPDGSLSRIREVGGDFSQWRREHESIQRLEDRMSKMGVGPKLVVQRQRDREMLSIREITTEPDLGAAPGIEEIHYYVWEGHEVRSGGLFLCRFIDGTRSVSKHGYLTSAWKGAAEDIFVTQGGMTALVGVAEDIVSHTKSGQLNAATVIVDHDIWTPSDGWHVYSGIQHFHVHVDVPGGSACRP